MMTRRQASTLGALSVLLTSVALGPGCLELPTSLRAPILVSEPLGYGTEVSPVADAVDEVRFAVIGDEGLTNHVQGTIARGVHKACAGRCDFVTLLGDNLYEAGMADATDEARLACIVSRYPSEHAYLVLGNHDYRIIDPQRARAERQLRWIERDTAEAPGSIEAHGGHHFYRFRAGPVDVVALDTNHLVRTSQRSDYEELSGWLGRLPRTDGRWTIVMGHHPVWSNGAHGNAGSYRDGGLSLWRGRFFKLFMDSHVLGRAHLYLAGHDHNLQFFGDPENRGTAQLVSGAGAKCKARGEGVNRADMERYGHGFSIVTATRDKLTVRFYDFRGDAFWATSRGRKSDAWTVEPGYAAGPDPRNRCVAEQASMTPETALPDPCVVASRGSE